jgi:hypothetical protein
VIVCSTRLRPPLSLGPDRIVRLASEAGFAGIAVDHACSLPLLRTVASEALRSGMPALLAGCPLPEGELGKGKRLPRLAALDDPEERQAAVALAKKTLELATDLDIRLLALDLGPAGLKTSEAQLRLRFARREMDADEPGGRLLKRALEERRARAGRIFDACRLALEPLLEAAGRRGATLALPLAPTPWQLPSPREAQLLLREFTGAPLRLVACPAHRAVLRLLELGGPPERWPELEAQGQVVLATDQVGLDSDLLLGEGELDDEDLRLAKLAEGTPTIVVSGPMDAAFRDVRRARLRLESLPEAAGQAADAR